MVVACESWRTAWPRAGHLAAWCGFIGLIGLVGKTRGLIGSIGRSVGLIGLIGPSSGLSGLIGRPVCSIGLNSVIGPIDRGDLGNQLATTLEVRAARPTVRLKVFAAIVFR